MTQCQTTYWGHHGVIWGLLSDWIGALTTWGGSHFSSFYPFYGVAFPTLKRVWPFLLKLFATTMTGVKASLQVIESFMKVLRLLLNSDVNDTTTCPRIRLHFRHKMGQKWKWGKRECLPCIVRDVSKKPGHFFCCLSLLLIFHAFNLESEEVWGHFWIALETGYSKMPSNFF